MQDDEGNEFGCPPGKGYTYKDLADMLSNIHKYIGQRATFTFFERTKQVVTGTRYLNAYVTMNKEIIIVPTCDMCGKLLTESEHPNCCSDCWEENAKYYE